MSALRPSWSFARARSIPESRLTAARELSVIMGVKVDRDFNAARRSTLAALGAFDLIWLRELNDRYNEPASPRSRRVTPCNTSPCGPQSNLNTARNHNRPAIDAEPRPPRRRDGAVR